MKNANGNTLDAKVVSVIKEMGQQSNSLSDQLLQTKQALRGNQEGYNAELAKVRAEIEDTEAQSRSLVDSLSRAGGTAAEKYIMERIEELNQSAENARRRMQELESIVKQHALADMEFDILRPLSL